MMFTLSRPRCPICDTSLRAEHGDFTLDELLWRHLEQETDPLHKLFEELLETTAGVHVQLEDVDTTPPAKRRHSGEIGGEGDR